MARRINRADHLRAIFSPKGGTSDDHSVEALQAMTDDELCELYDELSCNRTPFVDYTDADETLHTIDTILEERGF